MGMACCAAEKPKKQQTKNVGKLNPLEKRNRKTVDDKLVALWQNSETGSKEKPQPKEVDNPTNQREVKQSVVLLTRSDGSQSGEGSGRRQRVLKTIDNAPALWDYEDIQKKVRK